MFLNKNAKNDVKHRKMIEKNKETNNNWGSRSGGINNTRQPSIKKELVKMIGKYFLFEYIYISISIDFIKENS